MQIVRLPVFDRMIENRTFKEIAVGESASLSRTVTQQDIELFAIVSGDVNPAHLDPAYAETDMFHKIVAQGILEAGLISAVLGTKLPGPGTIYLGQDLRFLRPVGIGDEITATLTVTEKHEDKGNLVLDCRCTNQKGELVISGTAHVRAPTEKVRRPRYELPDVQLNRHQRFRALMTEAAGHDPVPTAVAYPCDAAVLGSVVEAARARLIAPILVGPIQKIVRAAAAAKADISCFRLVDAPTSEAAVAQAVMLVRKGEASVLMQGSVATGDLLDAVEAPGSGLKTGRRLTHVHLMDVPSYPRPLLITDAALAIAPDLEHKRDIMQNAIDLARVMGIATPRVAIISAIETVDPKLRSTLDAAALCKMADRGQITGGFVDGPLTFDNAVSPAAAARRGIVSEVAGKADILVVPDLEAGDMLVKQLTLLAGADAAGVLLGARVPIVLATGADAERTRLASCAVAVLVARGQAAGVGAACRA